MRGWLDKSSISAFMYTAGPIRSWHLALPVKEQGNSCILIHGGFDGDEVGPVID